MRDPTSYLRLIDFWQTTFSERQPCCSHTWPASHSRVGSFHVHNCSLLSWLYLHAHLRCICAGVNRCLRLTGLRGQWLSWVKHSSFEQQCLLWVSTLLSNANCMNECQICKIPYVWHLSLRIKARSWKLRTCTTSAVSGLPKSLSLIPSSHLSEGPLKFPRCFNLTIFLQGLYLH